MSIYDFTATTIDGASQPLSDFRGQVLLVTNVASKCGFTPQYEGLEKLYETYSDQGLAVLGFPCDQFGHQEPGDEAEIKEFCTLTYQVKFPMFAKIQVNGDDADPLYQWLRSQKAGVVSNRIKWNFTKFLVGRDGEVIDRFAPTTKPEKLTADIERAIAAQWSAIPRVRDAAAASAAIVESGAAIVSDVLDAGDRAELEASITSIEADHPYGRNVFEGERSHRLYSLIARGRPFERLAQHPLAVAVNDQLLAPNWLLSNCQSIRLYPGETHQPWHTDDAFYPVPRPHASPLGVSTIWALDRFTAANGATEVLARSHRWADEHPDDRSDALVATAEMDPGSVLIFDASLWHRGGANTTNGTRLCMTIQYCQPWLRPQESQLLIAPPSVAAGLSPRVRSMLGYSIHPPFIGQVEGKHPLRLVDEEAYRAERGDDSAVAERILRRPDATF